MLQHLGKSKHPATIKLELKIGTGCCGFILLALGEVAPVGCDANEALMDDL